MGLLWLPYMATAIRFIRSIRKRIP
ncbi:hypothetical protein KIPB_008832, partial [Kipferlia bialata]